MHRTGWFASFPVFFLAVAICSCSGTPPAAPDVVADTAPEITTCADGLMLWEEYNVCAPRVDDCPNPWELPLIGGGCMAIGPRACPKGWDPDSEVDCEPGELLEYDGSACPEGFVLTEDEVACIPFFQEGCGEMEIPVLGGGCKKVGPEWYDPELPYGGLEVPYFDECPEGLLALEGGGCIQVGPRACPKLWDPEADVGCEVGDVLPCPEGWEESEDGMYCDPGYAECGPGERALVGGECERVIPLAEDCPVGPFPEVPEGATEVVYASAGSACEDGCGSPGAPYASLQAAVNAVADGGYVLVGPGTYEEGVLLEKPVHVIGLCASRVMVAGAVVLPGESPMVSLAGVAVVGADNVGLSGIRIASPVVGLAIVESTGAHVTQVEIGSVAGLGVYVAKGSEVALDRLWVHDTVAAADSAWMEGYGLWVVEGADVSVSEGLVEGALGAGVFIKGIQTRLTMAETVVRNTQSLVGGTMGYGMLATGGAEAAVSGCMFEENTEIEVGVADFGTQLEVSDTVVRDTTCSGNGKCGMAMTVGEGAAAEVSGCLFQGNRVGGVGVYHSGTVMELSRTVVRDTKPGKNDESGMGVYVTLGAEVAMSGCLLEENVEVGVMASRVGTRIELLGTVVRDTQPNKNGDGGYGMQVGEAATATISVCVFEENSQVGVVIADSDTQVDLSATVIRRTRPGKVGADAAGIHVSNAATAVVSGCLVEGNAQLGVALFHAGTSAEFSGTVVRETKPDEDGEFGFGMWTGDAATATVSGCLFEGNVSKGVSVASPGALVVLADTVVRETKARADGEDGIGMVAVDGATAAVMGCLFEGSAEMGVLAVAFGTHVNFVNSVVRDAKPVQSGGHGMAVGFAATAVISDCLFERNASTGVSVAHPGTQAELSATVMRDTEPGEPGISFEMQVYGAATATFSGCLFERNSDVSIAIGEPGTHVKLTGTVMRNSNPDESGAEGAGMQVSHAATAIVSDCLFERSTSTGIFVVHDGTQVELSGTVVRDTVPSGQGESDHGILIADGAKATISSCMFEGNAALGLATVDFGTELELLTTVVRDTKPRESGVEGIGIATYSAATATVSGCLFEGNTSAGAAVLSTGTQAEFLGSVVRDTKPDVGGNWGAGIIVTEGAKAGAQRCLFRHNASIGILASHQGTSLGLETCAVFDTQIGGLQVMTDAGIESQAFGDGIMAAPECSMDLASTVVMDNARTGAYYYGAGGTIDGSVIAGNSSYGLAMEDSAEHVKHEGLGNYIFGNALNLSADEAAEVTTNPKGLPVPPAPEVSEVLYEPLVPAE